MNNCEKKKQGIEPLNTKNMKRKFVASWFKYIDSIPALINETRKTKKILQNETKGIPHVVDRFMWSQEEDERRFFFELRLKNIVWF